jgi:hypothetical protein
MSLELDKATPASLRAPATSRQALFAGVTGSFMLRGPQVAFAPDNDGGSSDGPLSMDDAISILTSDEAPDGDTETEDEAELEAADTEARDDDEDEAEDQSAAEDDAPEQDDPASEDSEDEDEEAEPDPEPVVEPPRFWSAEERALFAKAPPEVQRIIVAREAEASRQVSLAKEAAAEARKESQVIAEFGDKIGEALERAQSIFTGKWDNIDWAQWAREDVSSYAAAKEEFEAEQAELTRLQAAHEAAQKETHRQFMATESVKLAEAVPELADPTEGRNRKAELVAMLREDGFSPDDLMWAGAKELRIAWEALQWRRANAKAKADPPKPAKTPEPAKAKAPKPAGPVRPAAAAPPRKTVIQRRKAEVVGRAFKTGRMDDAVAAVLALEGK